MVVRRHPLHNALRTLSVQHQTHRQPPTDPTQHRHSQTRHGGKQTNTQSHQTLYLRQNFLLKHVLFLTFSLPTFVVLRKLLLTFLHHFYTFLHFKKIISLTGRPLVARIATSPRPRRRYATFGSATTTDRSAARQASVGMRWTETIIEPPPPLPTTTTKSPGDYSCTEGFERDGSEHVPSDSDVAAGRSFGAGCHVGAGEEEVQG